MGEEIGMALRKKMSQYGSKKVMPEVAFALGGGKCSPRARIESNEMQLVVPPTVLLGTNARAVEDDQLNPLTEMAWVSE